ncbi:MAG: hypothetical protein QF561_00380 [Phycisphaerales bacterium]|nr:hypothetical protein [Phycisphaerales bacterium]
MTTMLDGEREVGHDHHMILRGAVVLCVAAVSLTAGCGPEETASMRADRAARASEAAERRALLQQGRDDTAAQLRELGVGR